MNNSGSDYRKFVEMQQSGVRDPWPYEIFTSEHYNRVKCSLWPKLVLPTDTAKARESRHSGKVAYHTKVLGQMLDYMLSYEILHCQYDRWMFKTITGAVNSARLARCSPAKSLDEKTFSYGFWQHRFLIDAVRQHGYPSFFVTISPYEWTFPFPPWLDNIREVAGRSHTELPIAETLHIAHVLEQLVRGHICGANTNRWRSHIFTCYS
ncbi:hypothetical protein OS493_030357 [Desmophyllum pertusum]|uniref:Uncharacterized protein n=1 Tax=Desmophyllum pertusum TaxID=174260 RepID=A0A9X0CWP9_9CNID|nr:hypothetical protein OS493_030357 [Desmophyllum pertusum]